MAPAIALFAAVIGLQESPKSACGPVSSPESRNCTQRCPSELSTLCDAHKDVPAALLGFEEDSLWIPRLDEFNSCTGSRITLTYTLLGEDGMADALEADCGTVAPTPSEGAGIYDGYVVQAPWVPNVEPLLENLSPRIAATPEIDWLDINPTSRSIVSFSNTARWPVPPTHASPLPMPSAKLTSLGRFARCRSTSTSSRSGGARTSFGSGSLSSRRWASGQVRREYRQEALRCSSTCAS